MKKFFQGLILGAALGAGSMWWIGPNYEDVTLEPLPTTIEQEYKKAYTASMDSDTLGKLLEDGKAAPCYCSENKSKIGRWCEHEDLYCGKNTIKECEKRFENHTCFSGRSVNIQIPRK